MSIDIESLPIYSQITDKNFRVSPGDYEGPEDIIKLVGDRGICLRDKHKTDPGKVITPEGEGTKSAVHIEITQRQRAFGFSFLDARHYRTRKPFIDTYYAKRKSDANIISGSKDLGIQVFKASGKYCLIMWVAKFKTESLAELFVDFLNKALEKNISLALDDYEKKIVRKNN